MTGILMYSKDCISVIKKVSKICIRMLRWLEMNFRSLVEKQRNYFEQGNTRNLEFRISMLRKLQSAIRSNENLFCEAMKKDMNKCPSEVYMTEIGMVLEELSFH